MSRYASLPAERELSAGGLDAGAASLEVGQGVVETDILLALQVQVGLAPGAAVGVEKEIE